jgi:hypothetical protein
VPLFSAFTPFGLLDFSSEPSDAEKIYGSLVRAYRDPKGNPTIDCSPGTHQEAKIYGWSIALANALATVKGAANELRPETSFAQLEAHEEKFGMCPSATDTVVDRRNALAARQKQVRGPRYEAVVDALRTVLGSRFIAYRPMKISEAFGYPHTGDVADGPGIFARPDRIAKTVRILDAIARVGRQMTLRYENWNRSLVEVILNAGEQICLDPGDWALAERLPILAASGTGTERTITVQCTRAHSAGVFATTGPMPMWINTKRHVLVVVTSEAATSPPLRARVDEVMRRMMRAPTTWSIVQPTTAGASTTGPFRLGTTPLGAAPVQTITI